MLVIINNINNRLFITITYYLNLFPYALLYSIPKIPNQIIDTFIQYILFFIILILYCSSTLFYDFL